MILARLLCCTLAFAGCATSGSAQAPRLPVRSQLCRDHGFQCMPASLPSASERPIQIDTNLASPPAEPPSTFV